MSLWSERECLLRGTVREVVKRLAQSFLSFELGFASVDTAAAQALIGKSALEGLERQLGSRGMRAARLNLKHLPKSAGIGGCGKVVRVVLVPVSVRGADEKVFVVLGQDIPPLLPTGLLEKLGVLIDILADEHVGLGTPSSGNCSESRLCVLSGQQLRASLFK